MILNLYGAPGAGKSTTRAGVFHRLKLLGYNCEEVPEVAKDFTWEGRSFALSVQPYVFGKQLRNMQRVLGKVDVVITDSPVLLASYYGGKYGSLPASWHQSCLEISRDLGPELNFFIRRVKKYNPAGRNQTEAESDEVGDELWRFLVRNQVPFVELPGNEDAPHFIVQALIDDAAVRHAS